MTEPKTVFITDASAGFGLLSAKSYAQQGCNVIAAMRNPHQQNELNQLENVLVVKVDTTSKEMIEAAVWQALSSFGRIDALINNAAHTPDSPEISANKEQALPPQQKSTVIAETIYQMVNRGGDNCKD